MAQTLDRDVVVGRGTLFFRAAIFFLPELRISTPHQAGFLDPREDSPPSAKDKAPGEKQMPTGPYVPLAVASESA